MRKYYIVTQADTDENQHFQYAIGVFQDDNGNTELYANAEEARESLAKDVAEMCQKGNAFAVNDEEEVAFENWKEVYEYVMKHLKPEGNQYVLVMFSDGSERNYTINEIII